MPIYDLSEQLNETSELLGCFINNTNSYLLIYNLYHIMAYIHLSENYFNQILLEMAQL